MCTVRRYKAIHACQFFVLGLKTHFRRYKTSAVTPADHLPAETCPEVSKPQEQNRQETLDTPYINIVSFNSDPQYGNFLAHSGALVTPIIDVRWTTWKQEVVLNFHSMDLPRQTFDVQSNWYAILTMLSGRGGDGICIAGKDNVVNGITHEHFLSRAPSCFRPAT